jgi:hypothetical protein
MTTSGRHEGETWPDEVQAAEGIVEMEKEKAVKKDRLLCGLPSSLGPKRRLGMQHHLVMFVMNNQRIKERRMGEEQEKFA